MGRGAGRLGEDIDEELGENGHHDEGGGVGGGVGDDGFLAVGLGGAWEKSCGARAGLAVKWALELLIYQAWWGWGLGRWVV